MLLLISECCHGDMRGDVLSKQLRVWYLFFMYQQFTLSVLPNT